MRTPANCRPLPLGGGDILPVGATTTGRRMWRRGDATTAARTAALHNCYSHCLLGFFGEEPFDKSGIKISGAEIRICKDAAMQ